MAHLSSPSVVFSQKICSISKFANFLPTVAKFANFLSLTAKFARFLFVVARFEKIIECLPSVAKSVLFVGSLACKLVNTYRYAGNSCFRLFQML